MTKRNIVVSTLGPSGTCSEHAARYFVTQYGYAGKINLYSTFEESVNVLMQGESDFSIIPTAYSRLDGIVFNNYSALEINHIFKLITPDLVIVKRKDGKRVRKVASHSSPLKLARDYFPDAEMIIAKSNSDAANLFLAEAVDACLTTILCAEQHSLNVVHNFGGVVMGWNALKKRIDK